MKSTLSIARMISMTAILAFASASARANERCEGVTDASIRQNRLTAALAYDAFSEGIVRLQQPGETDVFIQDLVPWQVRGLRTGMAELARQGRRLFSRYDVDRSHYSGRPARYYIQVRRAIIAWESRVNAAWRRLAIPERHPVRQYFAEAIRTMRHASYRVMRHASCVSEDVILGRLNPSVDTQSEGSPVVEQFAASGEQDNCEPDDTSVPIGCGFSAPAQ